MVEIRSCQDFMPIIEISFIYSYVCMEIDFCIYVAVKVLNFKLFFLTCQSFNLYVAVKVLKNKVKCLNVEQYFCYVQINRRQNVRINTMAMWFKHH